MMLEWDMRFIFINLEFDSTTIINWLIINSVKPLDVVSLIFLLQEPYERSIDCPYISQSSRHTDTLAKRGSQQ